MRRGSNSFPTNIFTLSAIYGLLSKFRSGLRSFTGQGRLSKLGTRWRGGCIQHIANLKTLEIIWGPDGAYRSRWMLSGRWRQTKVHWPRAQLRQRHRHTNPPLISANKLVTNLLLGVYETFQLPYASYFFFSFFFLTLESRIVCMQTFIRQLLSLVDTRCG